MYKNIFLSTAENFTKLTGVKVEFDNQGSNGKYLFFYTSDNGGIGFHIGVDGYKDAIGTLDSMRDGYILAKKGKFL